MLTSGGVNRSVLRRPLAKPGAVLTSRPQGDVLTSEAARPSVLKC